MLKNKNKSSEMRKKRPRGYYTMIANACGCSVEYVKMVLYKGFNSYKSNDYSNRDTELVQKIKQKALELEQVINPTRES